MTAAPLLGALAMTASLLDHPLISERYFFPRRERIASPFLVETGDATLACAFRKVAPDAPTLVHFHGNGEVVGDWEDFARWLGTLGWNVLLAEYRGYGTSTGTRRLGKMLDDVERIVGRPASRRTASCSSAGRWARCSRCTRCPASRGRRASSSRAGSRT
jgi:fermentation-respiration switch protein FrsA (DUF1100 family)